jgi:hypothetical protein
MQSSLEGSGSCAIKDQSGGGGGGGRVWASPCATPRRAHMNRRRSHSHNGKNGIDYLFIMEWYRGEPSQIFLFFVWAVTGHHYCLAVHIGNLVPWSQPNLRYFYLRRYVVGPLHYYCILQRKWNPTNCLSMEKCPFNSVVTDDSLEKVPIGHSRAGRIGRRRAGCRGRINAPTAMGKHAWIPANRCKNIPSLAFFACS